MLAGMRALPDDGWNARANGSDSIAIASEWECLGQRVGHVFTHFSLELQIAVTAWPDGASGPGEGEWWPVKSLDKAGLPTLFSKVAKAVLSAGER